MKKKLGFFIFDFILFMGMTSYFASSANAAANGVGVVKVKKGHWTNKCGCKWPGKACNRKTK